MPSGVHQGVMQQHAFFEELFKGFSDMCCRRFLEGSQKVSFARTSSTVLRSGSQKGGH